VQGTGYSSGCWRSGSSGGRFELFSFRVVVLKQALIARLRSCVVVRMQRTERTGAINQDLHPAEVGYRDLFQKPGYRDRVSRSKWADCNLSVCTFWGLSAASIAARRVGAYNLLRAICSVPIEKTLAYIPYATSAMTRTRRSHRAVQSAIWTVKVDNANIFHGDVVGEQSLGAFEEQQEQHCEAPYCPSPHGRARWVCGLCFLKWNFTHVSIVYRHYFRGENIVRTKLLVVTGATD